MRPTFAWLAGIGMVLLAMPAATRGDGEDREKALGLVSLEYRLGDRNVPRSHELEPYKLLLDSNEDGVPEVAALSATWEMYAVEQYRAFRTRIGATEGLLGGLSPRPPGGNDAVPDEVARRQEEAARLVGPLQGAIRAGRLAAYQKAALIVGGLEYGADLGFRGSVRNIITAQYNDYGLQATLAAMQDVLWTRCEALAKSAAGGGELPDVEVVLRIERGRGFVVAARNKSANDLNHVTLAAIAKKTPVRGPTDAQNRALGAAASRLSRQRDPAKIAEQADTFADSAAFYYDLRNRPARIFLHLPVLPAGAEVTTVLIGSTAEMQRAEAPTFSLWADEGSLENRPVGGMDELRAEMARNARIPPPNRRPGVAPNPLFGGGGTRPAVPRPQPRPQPPNAVMRPAPAASGMAGIWLNQARGHAEKDPIRAHARFRQIVAQFPKAPEADEARAWLRDYPQLLMDRAGALAQAPETMGQAAAMYRQVVSAKPNSDQARAALEALDGLGPQLMNLAGEKESAGDTAGAAAIYRQIVRDLPKSKEATAARARLKSAGGPSRKGGR